MTREERAECDADPLWNVTGMIRWLLDQRGEDADLMSIAEIAEELRVPQPAVLRMLKVLERRGEVGHRTLGGASRWGSTAQLRRLDRQHDGETVPAYARRNGALAQVREELREALTDRDIGVFSLSDVTPDLRHDRRADQLVIATDDPAEAAWLLSRLTSDDRRRSGEG